MVLSWYWTTHFVCVLQVFLILVVLLVVAISLELLMVEAVDEQVDRPYWEVAAVLEVHSEQYALVHSEIGHVELAVAQTPSWKNENRHCCSCLLRKGDHYPRCSLKGGAAVAAAGRAKSPARNAPCECSCC